jgi:hypothetical protein
MTAASDLLGLAKKDRDDRQDTAVPLEARLLRDAQGKMMFIGDCAPLSFLQTVRQSFAAKVPSAALPSHLSRDAVIEVRTSDQVERSLDSLPFMTAAEIELVLIGFYEATSGLVDFFDDAVLKQAIYSLTSEDCVDARSRPDRQKPVGAVLCIVVAIGLQENSDENADLWFQHGKAVLMSHVNNDMTIYSVRGFALASLYMLRAFQPNAAYLNFGT